MSILLIRQPDGLFALFSVEQCDFLEWDLAECVVKKKVSEKEFRRGNNPDRLKRCLHAMADGRKDVTYWQRKFFPEPEIFYRYHFCGVRLWIGKS